MKCLTSALCLMASLTAFSATAPKNLNEALNVYSLSESSPSITDFELSSSCTVFYADEPTTKTSFSYAKQVQYVDPNTFVDKVVIGIFAGTYGNEGLNFFRNEATSSSYKIKVLPGFFPKYPNGVNVLFRKDLPSKEMPFLVVGGLDESKLLAAGICPAK